MNRGNAAVLDSREWLYWTGCAANYDPRVAAIVQATVKVLRAAGLRMSFLGEEEACSGEPARRLGEEGLFQQLALQNIATLQRHRVAQIVTHCAHCFHVLKNEYPRFGGNFEVAHHSELIAHLLDAGQLKVHHNSKLTATLHDSCYIGRYNRIFDAPRTALRAVQGDRLFVEMPRHAERSFCCGAGGANYWFDAPKSVPAGALRIAEARASGAGIIVAECPFCVKMLEQGRDIGTAEDGLIVKDIAEIVADALEPDESGTPSGSPGPTLPPVESHTP